MIQVCHNINNVGNFAASYELLCKPNAEEFTFMLRCHQ